MKQGGFWGRTLMVLVGLFAAAGSARAADAVADELIARVQRVTPGGREFSVTDRHGVTLRVVRPARPPQASDVQRDGELVDASALREGDLVRLTGVNHGNWFEARRVEVLTGTRVGGATTAERVLRFTGFAGGRELRAVSADGTEYRIILPPKPQAFSVWKGGDLVELSALREGDRFVAHGVAQDRVIRAERLEVLEARRLGRGASVALTLTYRGSAGWRRLIGEAADGTRYLVTLPPRPQVFYFHRDGVLVEPSALKPGDTFEVRGIVRGDAIEASRILLR